MVELDRDARYEDHHSGEVYYRLAAFEPGRPAASRRADLPRLMEADRLAGWRVRLLAVAGFTRLTGHPDALGHPWAVHGLDLVRYPTAQRAFDALNRW